MVIQIFNRKFFLSELWKLRSSLGRLLLHPAKVWNFIIVYLSRITRRHSVVGLPPFLMLEPTSRCNMACPMCPFLIHQKERRPADMSIDHYCRLLNEIGPTLLTISLWGWGEPLMNASLPGMIRVAKGYGVFVSVSTNAYSMSRQRANEFIDAGLDYLVLSLDGATDVTYSKYRSKGKFDKVINNIRALQEEKKKRKVRHPFTDIQFIVMRDNEHEVPLIRKLAQDLGVDKLSIKKIGLIDEGDKETMLPRNDRYIHQIYKGGPNNKPCSRPWNTPFITASGDVIVCCGDIKYVHNFGNIFEGRGFKKIWNGPEFKQFRKRVTQNINQIAACRRCPSKSFEDGFVS